MRGDDRMLPTVANKLFRRFCFIFSRFCLVGSLSRLYGHQHKNEKSVTRLTSCLLFSQEAPAVKIITDTQPSNLFETAFFMRETPPPQQGGE
jgi:hypothetical protein